MKAIHERRLHRKNAIKKPMKYLIRNLIGSIARDQHPRNLPIK
jgi:hypothetical protein